MKKRTIKIEALSDGVNVKVQATVNAGAFTLTETELDRLKSRLTRELAEALTYLPFPDFGIDNISVR